MSFIFSLYGLGVQANLLPAGLRGLPKACRVDVMLSLGWLPEDIRGEDLSDAEPFYVSDDRDEADRPLVRISRVLAGRFYRCDYADGTCIAVDSDGTAVWATWPDSATLEDTATYLLGSTFSFLLRLRGSPCLHASVVNISGKAVVLVGPSGAGKSSLAAAFAQRGRPVLSDDVAAMEVHGSSITVQPGYARVRLWPAAVGGLFGTPEALPRLTPTWEKRFLDLRGTAGGFQERPLPLGAIFLLDTRAESAEARVCRLDKKDALLRIVANTSANHLLTPSMRAEEFDVLARMVQAVPLRLVQPGHDISHIDRLCQAIADEFFAIEAAVSAISCAVPP
jgi:hypothetical protein